MISIIRKKTKRPIFAAMFKQITAILLLLVFSVQTFSSPFIMLDYFVNTATYAKNCVNKARPKMHCNGKCQMMKKMQQEERKEQQNSERKAETKIQVLSSKSFFNTLTVPLTGVGETFYYIVTGSPVSRTVAVFHPPQA